MGFDEAGDAGGGEAEHAEDGGEVMEVGRWGGSFGETAGEEVEVGNFFGEVGEGGGFEWGEGLVGEAVGVVAVLEGVGVAGLATTMAFRRGEHGEREVVGRG